MSSKYWDIPAIISQTVPKCLEPGLLTRRSGCVHLEDPQTNRPRVSPPVNSQWHSVISKFKISLHVSIWNKCYLACWQHLLDIWFIIYLSTKLCKTIMIIFQSINLYQNFLHYQLHNVCMHSKSFSILETTRVIKLITRWKWMMNEKCLQTTTFTFLTQVKQFTKYAYKTQTCLNKKHAHWTVCAFSGTHLSVLHLSVFDSQLRLFITKRDIEWMTGRALMVLIPLNKLYRESN